MPSFPGDFSFINALYAFWPELQKPKSCISGWELLFELPERLHAGSFLSVRTRPTPDSRFDTSNLEEIHLRNLAESEPLVLFRDCLSVDDCVSLVGTLGLISTAQNLSITEALGFMVNVFIATMDITTTSEYLKMDLCWPATENITTVTNDQGVSDLTWRHRPLFSIEFFTHTFSIFQSRGASLLFDIPVSSAIRLSYLTVPPIWVPMNRTQVLGNDDSTPGRLPLLVERDLVPEVARHAEYLSALGSKYRTVSVQFGDLELTGPSRNQELAPQFRRKGKNWKLSFAGVDVVVNQSQGMQYIEHLLANPHIEVHVLELMEQFRIGGPIGFDARRVEAEALTRSGELHSTHMEGTGATLDAAAKKAFRARLGELSVDIEEAEELGNSDRAEELKGERSWLIKELSNATGFRGRDRATNSATERARTSIQKAIKTAIKRIGDTHPSLASHLSRSITTGTYCKYDPDRTAQSNSSAE